MKDTNKSHADPGNYRPIFLQSTPFKLLDAVVDKRIQDKIFEHSLLHPEQGGFVRKRGTQEQSGVLREISCFARETSSDLFAAFIDCKAAFDRVLRAKLFGKLKKFAAVTEDELNIMLQSYKNTKAKLGDLIFDVESGIREGGHSSPGSFNIHTNDLTTRLKATGEGFTILLIVDGI